MAVRRLCQLSTKWTVAVAAAMIGLSVAGCQSTSSEVSKVSHFSMTESASSGKEKEADKVAKIRTQMAAQYVSENKLDAAKRQLEKALFANKRYAPAYDMMGVLLQREGSRLNVQKSEEYFKQAIQIDPSFMQARNNYGVYLSQLGRDKEAIKQFEIAGAALGYEGRIGALENLGRAALKTDNVPLASKSFVRVLESNRNSVIAHIELVDILIDSDRITQAQNLYNEMLVIVGKDANKVPRILLQGIKLAHAQNNLSQQEKLSRQLLADFPLSEEAKKLKDWIRKPEASWK